MIGNLGTQAAIVHALVHMRQYRVPDLRPPCEIDRHIEMRMCRVRPTAQAIDHEDVGSIETLEHGWRDFAEIRRIDDRLAIGLEPEPGAGDRPVRHLDMIEGKPGNQLGVLDIFQ